MNKDHIIYSLLFICVFFMTSISLLSLQNNDIRIPQNNKTVTLDLRYKFNLNLAAQDYSKKYKTSN